MQDWLSVGSVPYAEDCAQVGNAGYRTIAKKECDAFINQLRRTHGDEPDNTKLEIKYCPHDFGTYLDVVCYYDNDEGMRYGLLCENTPEYWDKEAKIELGLVEKK